MFFLWMFKAAICFAVSLLSLMCLYQRERERNCPEFHHSYRYRNIIWFFFFLCIELHFFSLKIRASALGMIFAYADT